MSLQKINKKIGAKKGVSPKMCVRCGKRKAMPGFKKGQHLCKECWNQLMGWGNTKNISEDKEKTSSLQKIIANIKKLAETNIYKVHLYDLDWDIPEDEDDPQGDFDEISNNLPNKFTFKSIKAGSEEEAVQKAVNALSNEFDITLNNVESKVELLKRL